tara:strand:- start:6545 stop:7366 length:822 start_codon:yes stop_codon:yes gene_type:complete
MLVFCSGMLRSGSAFQYNLVASLVESFGPCIRHGRWEPKEKIKITQLLSWAKDPEVYHIIKSARYDEEFELAQDGLAKIFYIHRDLRDVAVAAKHKWNISDDKLIEMLDRALSAHELMKAKGAFKDNSWCLVQKYEDVYFDNNKAVHQIAKFINLTPDISIINKVVENCTIDKMLKVTVSKKLIFYQKTLRFLGSMANKIKSMLPKSLSGSWGLRRVYLAILPKVDRQTGMAPRHIEPTKGKPGSWKDILSKQEITMINNRYKNYLIHENYKL